MRILEKIKKMETMVLNKINNNKELYRCIFCSSNCTDIINTTKMICRSKYCRRKQNIFINECAHGDISNVIDKLMSVEMWMRGARLGMISGFFQMNRNMVTENILNCVSIMKQIKNDHLSKLGGVNKMVEIDESKFGKRKYNRGRRVMGTWVVGLVERGVNGRIIIEPVLKRDKITLHDIIKKHVHEGTTIITDCWKGYEGLGEIGFLHNKINHSLEYSRTIGDFHVHTNTIEGHWRSLKELVPNRYRTSLLIEPYLNLYMLKRIFNDEIISFMLNKLVN